ncbi:hypothetical protein [Ensifer sp.]|uniref:portal protein n=1 Tax=Ensifer sp. TaxID=1872086 RepID=UPI00289D3731|nr:hypothetical protein [Ensifer sp.]
MSPDNPYVSPDNLYNGIAKTVEAAGLKSPDLYFTKPTSEDIQKRMQAAEPQQQPDVGMQQLQMHMQLANEEARMDGENARRKLEMAVARSEQACGRGHRLGKLAPCAAEALNPLLKLRVAQMRRNL